MATITIALDSYPEEISSIIELYSISGLSPAYSASAVESVYGNGLYTADFTDPVDGLYRVHHVDQYGKVMWSSFVKLDSTALFYNAHEAALVPSASASLDASGIRDAIGLTSANLDIQLTGIKGVVDNQPTNTFLLNAIASGDDPTLAAIAAEAVKTSGIKAKTDQLTFTVGGQVDSNTLTFNATGIRSAVGLASANLDIQLTGIKGVVDGQPTNTFILNAIASGDDPTLAAIAAEAIKTSGIKAKTDQLIFNSGQVSASVNSVTYSGFQDIFETYQYTESYPATGVNPTPAQSAFLSQQAFTNFTIAGTTISIIGLNGVTVVATYGMDDDISPTQRIRLT